MCPVAVGTLTQIIGLITCLVGLVIPLALALALLGFMWGVFKAFGKTDSTDGRAEARQAILWSAIALLVVATLGGIIAVFQETFPDLESRANPQQVATSDYTVLSVLHY